MALLVLPAPLICVWPNWRIEIAVNIDGALVAELNQYFHAGDESKLPVKDIHRLQLQGYLSFQGALYIDDVFIVNAED